MLSGAHFQVDDLVPTDGLLGHYTLRSGYGTFVVPGRELLRIRIAELAAIQQLEATNHSQEFLQAAGNAAAKPVQAVVSLVTDPVQTIQGIPSGISRFFDRVALGAKSIAQAASDTTKTEQERTQQTAERIGSATITALGFEQVRRELAKRVGVDPYTTNPVLSKKLTDIAWVGFSGRLGVNLLVSVFVPGSTAISGLSFTHDLVYDTPAADLLGLNRQKMTAMGASDAQVQALVANRWSRVGPDRARHRSGASRPRLRPSRGADPRRDRHEGGGGEVPGGRGPDACPPQRDGRAHSTVMGRETVIGVTRDGMLVVPAPVDYVSWTEKVGGFAMRSDLRATRRGIWLTGRMSGAAQQGFAARGWTFHDVTLPAGAR